MKHHHTFEIGATGCEGVRGEIVEGSGEFFPIVRPPGDRDCFLKLTKSMFDVADVDPGAADVVECRRSDFFEAELLSHLERLFAEGDRVRVFTCEHEKPRTEREHAGFGTRGRKRLYKFARAGEVLRSEVALTSHPVKLT